jgi:hypothetical protein
VKARRAASIALAAALLIGTAGCTLTAVQGTQVPYQPSDGTAATIGDIDLRNVLGLSDDGKSVALLLTVINNGSSEETINLQYETAEGKKTQKIKVDGDSSLGIGGEDQESLTLRGLNVQVGGLLPIYVQYGDEQGKQLQVPILDGELEAYSNLLPRPLPTFTPRPTESATPEPTETPAS